MKKGCKSIKDQGCNHGKKAYTVDRSATYKKGKSLPMHMTAMQGSKRKA